MLRAQCDAPAAVSELIAHGGFRGEIDAGRVLLEVVGMPNDAAPKFAKPALQRLLILVDPGCQAHAGAPDRVRIVAVIGFLEVYEEGPQPEGQRDLFESGKLVIDGSGDVGVIAAV